MTSVTDRINQRVIRRRLAFVLFGLVFLAFFINVLGWNIFTYFNCGEKELILAASVGVSHNAWAESLANEEPGDDLPFDIPTTIVEAGPLHIFLERRVEPMSPFSFRLIKPDRFLDYRGFEFPWLLLLAVPIGILTALGKEKEDRTDGT
ncbi:MAG: hypothetical protein P1V20_31785 [Verrucomicrobiales bacterium]|nr:hypothetical protein [Verrucomicrobiales bacterium]